MTFYQWNTYTHKPHQQSEYEVRKTIGCLYLFLVKSHPITWILQANRISIRSDAFFVSFIVVSSRGPLKKRFTIANIVKPQVVSSEKKNEWSEKKERNKSACDMCTIHKQILIIWALAKCIPFMVFLSLAFMPAETFRTDKPNYADSGCTGAYYYYWHICELKKQQHVLNQYKHIFKIHYKYIFILRALHLRSFVKIAQCNTWFSACLWRSSAYRVCSHRLNMWPKNERWESAKIKTITWYWWRGQHACADIPNKWAITNYALHSMRRACPMVFLIQLIENQ